MPTAEDMLVLSTIMTRKPLHPKLFERQEMEFVTNSRAYASSPTKNVVDKSTGSQLVRLLSPSHSGALSTVSTLSVSQSEAMSTWKVSKAQLGKLSYGSQSFLVFHSVAFNVLSHCRISIQPKSIFMEPTPSSSYRKINAAVRLERDKRLGPDHLPAPFSIASVESMALRLHCNEYGNGPVGHEEYKEKLEERKERIEATKRANGTWRPKVNRGPPRVLPRFRRRRYY